MASKIIFFPVGNGDMTLIKLNDPDKTTILIDMNIRNAADVEDDPTCDVAAELRKRIQKDKGRPYVDVFISSHPDKDHCTGIQNHFHLGPLDEYNYEPQKGEELKIVIRELWSSPMVFRRASKNNPLCDDAKALNSESKRRVKVFEDKRGEGIEEGDRIKILGEDENGKTDKLKEILVKVDECFSEINNKENTKIKMCLLGPLPIEDEKNEEVQAKNHSSVIIQFSIADDQNNLDACKFLTGGDAEVAIWERLWGKHKSKPDCLKYDLLLSPHHCSWSVFSYEGWNGGEGDPEVNTGAKSALSQANDGAFIVSSSIPIKNDTIDPPCVGAKKEYKTIADKFYCTGEHPDEKKNEPLEFTVTSEGPQPPAYQKGPYISSAGLSATREPLGHGQRSCS